MKIDDFSTAPAKPRAGRSILYAGLLILLVPPVWAGLEMAGNIRGPGRAPQSESAGQEGKALLARALAAHEAAAWAARDSVTFGVDCSKSLGGRLALTLTVEPGSRNARFVVAKNEPHPAAAYEYAGAARSLRPAGGDSADVAVLRQLAPSLVFWSLVPFVLDDPAAEAWPLPAVRRAGEERPRLAVRWPAAAEWYVFELRPSDARIVAVEFRSAGTSALIRWRGRLEGVTRADGVQLPGVWRFRPAQPVLALLLGMEDIYTFRYRPAEMVGS